MTVTAQELTSQGVALGREQRLGEAAECFEQAIRIDPNFALAHRNLGYARELLGNMEGALASYRRAVELNPTAVDVLKRLGEALYKTGAIVQAAECFQRACELAPENSAAFNDLGVALSKLGRHAEATVAYRRATELAPDSATAVGGLGAALTSLNCHAEAEHYLLRAIELDASEASAHSNLGILYKQLGRLDDALRHYNRAIELKPNYPEAQKARALCLLLKGDFQAGWPGYEWRAQMGDLRFVHPAPRWTGDPLAGRRLLIETEQGLGDTIHFIRYAAEVKRLHEGQVIVACEPPLVPLLRQAPGIDLLIAQDQPRPPFDVWASLLSLPGIFQHDLTTAAAPIPYLRAEPDRVAHWKTRLASIPGMKIGIAWQGNKENAQNHNRSFPLASLAPIAAISGASLVSLQKGSGAEELAASAFPVHQPGDDFDAAGGAFLDTAAVMMNLDLVISADTSVAHVAGALGVPVWVPLAYVPDWRW
ncbi:MAG: glycosyltransferase family protein, partial [Planctomycetia bacterium]|nr:glycosyltransferase family protein [Planctomycetia bacterium]